MTRVTHFVIELGPKCAAHVSARLALVVKHKPAKRPAHASYLPLYGPLGFWVRLHPVGRHGLLECTHDSSAARSATGPFGAQVVTKSLWRIPCARVLAATVAPCAALDLDLAAELLYDTLQLAQALHELHLALARVFGRRIRIFRSGTARGAARGRVDALDYGTAAVAARHLLVAADLSSAAGDAASGIEGWLTGGRHGYGLIGRYRGRAMSAEGRKVVNGWGVWRMVGVSIHGVSWRRGVRLLTCRREVVHGVCLVRRPSIV